MPGVPMKIGFIDHHLNNYHADVFHKFLTGPVGGGKVEIVAAFETDPVGDDWCAKTGVRRAGSAAEVVAQSDAVIVLAPDNIGEHLKLAKEALESGKPTLIDKMLSTSLEDAKQIAALAAKHNTPVMGSSSLRFAVEVEELAAALTAPVDAVFARGFGKFPGYSIHTIAPALRFLGGRPIRRVIDTGAGSVRLVTVDDGERRTLIEVRESENQYEATPWTVGVLSGGKYHVAVVTKFDDFYANLLKETLAFFTTGKTPISLQEMLESVAVEVLAGESVKQGGVWMDVAL